ncbi:hypothetical protein GWI33_001040 [Rhynchophorus ferrugineus]|uniref:RAP domain-containing protein n=2 Tax=Rhynchophorus ferrugineus TaxID=354439 RepID=A0A834ISP8_RHYFE|nr:hypothetical protein GWI33_001040 [Rhynchophorus ferrugineus]
MNISKHLVNLCGLCYKTRRVLSKKSYINLAALDTYNSDGLFSKSTFKEKCKYKFSSTEFTSTDYEATTDLYPYIDSEPNFQQEYSWSKLFGNDTDISSNILSKCASVEEVLQFVKEHPDYLTDKCLTQVILAMSNIQTIYFYHMNDEGARRDDFFKKLLEYKEFYTIVSSIEKKLSTYNPLYLSYAIFHLRKLGVPVENNFMQSMAVQIKNNLEENFSLEIAANLFKTIFVENSVRPCYIVINLLPVVVQHIDKIENIQDLEYLTICLKNISYLLTDDILKSFKSKVNKLIEDKVLMEKHVHALLKIILVFNHPRWRLSYSEFISKCILLMEEHIHQLNFTDLELLHEVLFLIQEPGDALNTIQRCSAKFLQQLEDSQTHRQARLKLFSSLIFFSSPINTIQFREDLHKYLSDNNTIENLTALRKIYIYLKVSDTKMNQRYWDNACQILKRAQDIESVMKLADNYLKFTSINSKYRHYAFEYHILQLLQKYYNERLLYRPSNFFTSFCFALAYCRDVKFFMKLYQSYHESFVKQLSIPNCLKISQTLGLSSSIERRVAKLCKEDIKASLLQATEKLFINNNDVMSNSLLVKAAIFRNDIDNDVISDMLLYTKNIERVSSKFIETICFNFARTDFLVPETLNRCVEYVVRNRRSIMGFNAERLLNLLYYLNYYPIYPDEFFQVVTDVIIRDQERLSTLAYLQTALSLSYFNRIPNSFVKQIFNVEFLDKLDIELTNSYFRDSYPYRVKYILMQLNRAMCLENPEYNIPWFHKKFVENFQKNFAIDDVSNRCHMRIREYLLNVVPKTSVLENSKLPYGYRVDFVIHTDRDQQPTTDFNDPQTMKLALLIKYSDSYTKNCVHLKGQDMLKNIHLEILGYKVKIIKWDDFANLLYSVERVEFIRNIIFS